MDDSEKARIPAWTDRILRKGTNLRQINYNTAPLRFSDHRPVYATFQCTVSIVDEAVREALSREIYEKRRVEVGGTIANTAADDTDDEDLIGYDQIEPGLPPASSDKRKWWLDTGKPARSELQPPQNGQVPNPSRPSNPYTTTEEPDWVTVPRMPPRKATTQVTPRPPNPRQISNGTRKLPPPFDPSGVKSINKDLSQFSINGLDTSRAASPSIQNVHNNDRRNSTSTNGSVSKKPPPVAKKPVHLISSPPLSSSPTLTPITRSTSRISQAPAQPPRQNNVDPTSFPPPPRRTTASSATGFDTLSRKGSYTNNSTPPLPPQTRRGGAGTMKKMEEELRPGLPPRPPRNFLDDDDDMGMSGWEALKPV